MSLIRALKHNFHLLCNLALPCSRPVLCFVSFEFPPLFFLSLSYLSMGD